MSFVQAVFVVARSVVAFLAVAFLVGLVGACAVWFFLAGIELVF